jgi:hypothetical protein
MGPDYDPSLKNPVAATDEFGYFQQNSKHEENLT